MSQCRFLPQGPAGGVPQDVGSASLLQPDGEEESDDEKPQIEEDVDSDSDLDNEVVHQFDRMWSNWGDNVEGEAAEEVCPENVQILFQLSQFLCHRRERGVELEWCVLRAWQRLHSFPQMLGEGGESLGRRIAASYAGVDQYYLVLQCIGDRVDYAKGNAHAL